MCLNFEGISWQEAQKNAESLRKLFIEVFPYLKASSAIDIDMTGGERSMEKPSIGSEQRMIAELRSEDYGIIKIIDETSIAMAKMVLESIDRKFKKKKEELNKA